MNHPAAASTLSVLNVKVCCQNCNMIFDNKKHFQGRRGCFKVISRGLTLHFLANNCDRPCLRYYMQQRLTTHKFTSSLSIYDVQTVDRQQPPATQLFRPSMPDSDSSDSLEDDHAFLFDEVDTQPPSSHIPNASARSQIFPKVNPSP